ncbi:MAG: ATP-binding cassette domain-containing protein [Pelagibacteraceae bacterium]|jgi:ATP-binding cassette subfamily C protein LapB|nr:ATP-binding cassette domain-containing protein [Pelagibacteraceae bacterium]|tara:strand:+ start:325 stop:2088 length:1764 start_codon:yes stop_codon:yes gene_type:complete
MKYVFFRLLLHPFLWVQLIVISFFVNILALALPIFVMQVLQRYIAYGVSPTLITLVSGVVIAIIFEFFFRNLRHRIARGLDEENHKIKEDALSKIQASKSAYGNLYKQPQYQRMDQIFQNLDNIFSASNITIILDLPFVLVFLIAIFLIHNTLGAITLFVMLLVVLVSFLMSFVINSVLFQAAAEQNRETKVTREIVSQHEIIKLFNYELILEKIWTQVVEYLLPVKKKLQARLHLSQSIMQTVVGLTSVAVIAVGATIVVEGELAVGGLIAANILAARALAPLIRYISIQPSLQRGINGLSELKNLTNVTEERTKGSVIENFQGKIKLEKLEFKYPDQKISLFRNISISVSPGQILVITGNNGTGKTTLVKLLMGVLEPDYGSISADQTLINQLQEPWWRQNIMYLPQETFFINGSLKLNIFGHKTPTSSSKITSVLIESGLKEFIDDQQNGINKTISSDGTELSPGIRKKIALARALNSAGQVVIFDEPTETMDQVGSSQMYQLINKLHKEKKTIIICSSDPYIIKGATTILHLNPKSGASIFTPKQLAQYQQKIMQKRKKFIKDKMEANKIKVQDVKINKKKLN